MSELSGPRARSRRTSLEVLLNRAASAGGLRALTDEPFGASVRA